METKNDKNESMEVTGYSLLIQYTVAELARVREIIKQAQLMEAALIKSLDSLQQVNITSVGTMKVGNMNELSDKIKSLQEPGYPYKGSKEDKILFILKKFNTVLRITDIASEIMRIEGGTDARSVQKGLNYKMHQMTADCKLVIAQVQRSNRHMFYCLPEFFSSLEKGNIVLKKEHYPSPESWGKLTESERNFSKAKWISFIK